jgi:hypothetical protein
MVGTNAKRTHNRFTVVSTSQEFTVNVTAH